MSMFNSGQQNLWLKINLHSACVFLTKKLQELSHSCERKEIAWHAQDCSMVEPHHSYDAELIVKGKIHCLCI